jgi:hypothetical protein
MVAAAALTACTMRYPTSTATPVPITDYRMVAGQWQGLLTGIPTRSADDSDAVRLTISDDGTYDFGVYRMIGAFEGKGRFGLRDGKLVTQHQPRPATFALYDHDGRRWLKGEGVVGDGLPVSVELKRTQ